MRKATSGGGWPSVGYTWRKAREVGPFRLWKAMTSKNACKTCAFGMGGQLGGMRNEAGHFPEVCKKSLQAMAADMRGRIERKFFETYALDQLRTFSPRELEAAGRLVEPMVWRAGDSHFRPATWDEALALVARPLRSTPPERAVFYASGRSSNEAGFLLSLFARCFGTNHVNNCSYYCHQASGAGLLDALGTATSTIGLDDLEHCDTVFLIGGNPASNHPRLMSQLVALRRRGGHVVVVNPMKEPGLESFRIPSDARSLFFGSEVASQYVQVRIGGDVAFLAGVAKWLLEHEGVDAPFLAGCAEGWDGLCAFLNNLSWDEVERESGVSRHEVEAAAQTYARSKGTVFAWTMGITHHEHGVQNVRWIANVALMRGMVGRPGAGLLPIRGHSNVQGMGSVGVTPAVREAVLAGLETLGIKPAGFKGYDTFAAVEAADRGEVDWMLCLGGNLFGASPDAHFTSTALSRIDTMAYMSTTLNTGHVHALGRTTVVLPVLARDEEHQSTTQESMFSFVRLSDGGIRRYEGPRSEVDVLSSLAHDVLGSEGPVDWERMKGHDEIRRLIARVVPNLGQLAEIGATKKEFEIPGRVLRKPEFATPSGKAKLHTDPLPSLGALADDELRLMTIRSEGQFNTVVYEDEDVYRGQDRRDVILMNSADASRMGLVPDQRVDLKTDTGTMPGLLVRLFDIAPGCAAVYYPECNVLVPRTADPRSKTPAFKSIVATLVPRTSADSEVVALSHVRKGPASGFQAAPSRRTSS